MPVMYGTKSGSALHDELPAAIELYHQNARYIHEHDDPSMLVDEARCEARCEAQRARPGSPYHRSALALAEMAGDEVRRRADA